MQTILWDLKVIHELGKVLKAIIQSISAYLIFFTTIVFLNTKKQYVLILADDVKELKLKADRLGECFG